MTEEQIFRNDVGDPWISRILTPRGHVCESSGISIMAMPPGNADLTLSRLPTTLNVIPNRNSASVDRLAVNGTPITTFASETSGLDIYASGADFEIRSTNRYWECLVQITDAKLDMISAESIDGRTKGDRAFASRVDRAANLLGQMAIDHLRYGEIDRIYLEGIGLAIAAKGLALFAEAGVEVTTAGTDARISRAIDFIEANLGRSFGVADCASVAGMSPSWFARCFRDVTGRPVHTYVRDRRLERARNMIENSTDSLAMIAHEFGFSDHAHMTRLFSKRYGMSPSRWKAERS